jgi:hypothetical protein
VQLLLFLQLLTLQNRRGGAGCGRPHRRRDFPDMSGRAGGRIRMSGLGRPRSFRLGRQ